jgi:lipid-binding SYLF domain-containing protein
MRSTSSIAFTLLLAFVFVAPMTGCSTKPKDQDQATFMAHADTATELFLDRVDDLDDQIEDSAGYIVFPDVAQWGILFGGGTWGRGALFTPDGDHEGWAALNTGSFGLQAGVRGFKMLIVIQDEVTLQNFKTNKLTGSVAGVLVGGEASAPIGRAPFSRGLAIYEHANVGLMAGMKVGLDYLRFRPLEEG